jgi:hypothetical protein
MLIPRHPYTIIFFFFPFHLPFFVRPFVTTAATGLPAIPIQDEV